MAALHRLLAPDERVHLVTREHGIVLVPAFLRTLLGLAMLTVVAVDVAGTRWLGPGRVAVAVAAGALAVWMLGGLVRVVMRWQTRRLVVTDRRALLLQGGLTRRVATLQLDAIDAIEVQSWALGRIVRCGGLVVTSEGRRAPLHGLRRLPDPDLVLGLVLGLDERIPATPRRPASAPRAAGAPAR
jgi:PH (Pleckstrin Homology) domain-containing protein